jgi:hypothetical protein
MERGKRGKERPLLPSLSKIKRGNPYPPMHNASIDDQEKE